jgi:hypothetical protein
MNILIDSAASATYKGGHIIVRMESGVEIKFPVKGNKRLARGTEKQLNNIEISPYGIHWPELDEDLSFEGLLAGDYGQYSRNLTSRCSRRATVRC